EEFAHWPGQRRIYRSGDAAAPRPPPPAAAAAGLPAWAGAAPDWRPTPPPPEPPRPEPLAPSRPEHADLGAVPEAASPLAADGLGPERYRRGTLIHALLQHLPGLAPPARAAAAARHLDRAARDFPPAARAAMVAEVLAILDHPALAPLFGPAGRAEQPLAGFVGGRVVGGIVDRLAVLPDRVLLADYKTNRAVPDRAEAVPVLYLRQMAAYRAVLAALYPDRPVEAVLVWTRDGAVMPLPGALLDAHAPRPPA
ncbi:MAG: PD-(D/E)XK nuclease family protein, partial [Acetobacteraceae bacterium]